MKMTILYPVAVVGQKPFKIIAELWRHCVTVNARVWQHEWPQLTNMHVELWRQSWSLGSVHKRSLFSSLFYCCSLSFSADATLHVQHSLSVMMLEWLLHRIIQKQIEMYINCKYVATQSSWFLILALRLQTGNVLKPSQQCTDMLVTVCAQDAKVR